MRKHDRKLLEYLYHAATYVTSTQLAQVLQVSQRSIKTYIKELNQAQKSPLIISTKKGYTVNHEQVETLLQMASTKLPQTYSERSNYIMKHLLLDEAFCDLDILCDQLCISESTLKTTITKWNKAYCNYHVKIMIQQNLVYMEGTEKDKRHLISSCIFDETGASLLSLSKLKEYFPYFHIEAIYQNIIQIFHEHHRYIDDFSLMNLMLHLLININRIIEGNYLEVEEEKHESKEPKTLLEHLYQYIEEEFSISLNPHERKEIEILIMASSVANGEDYHDIVDQTLLTFAQDITKKIYEHYALDLQTESFLLPFSLHLKKLSLRIQKHMTIRNPLSEDVKLHCPMIYDMAVFAAMQIQTWMHMETALSKEEIAYLSLHIGAEVERQKADLPKLRCALVCPSYMTFQDTIYNQLLLDFHEDINLLPPFADEEKLPCEPFDILFTTIELHRLYPHSAILFLSLMNTHEKRSIILSTIEQVKAKKRHARLCSQFHQFFFASLFYVSNEEATAQDTLSFLCDRLVEKGYIGTEFIEALYERERACPTCFHDFAIPHSIKMNAEKSCIAVLINQRDITWTPDTQIHIVFLIAINKADRLAFKDLYEALIYLLNDEKRLKAICACTNFEQFQAQMLHIA